MRMSDDKQTNEDEGKQVHSQIEIESCSPSTGPTTRGLSIGTEATDVGEDILTAGVSNSIEDGESEPASSGDDLYDEKNKVTIGDDVVTMGGEEQISTKGNV